jgi:hypothetical protein
MSGKKITLRDVLQLSRLRQHVYILKDEQLIIAGICSQIYRILDESLLNSRVLTIDTEYYTSKGLVLYLDKKEEE